MAYPSIRRTGRSLDKSGRPRRRTVLRGLELLEDRRLLSMSKFQVTTEQDNGDDINPISGSLRDGIVQANSNPMITQIEIDVDPGKHFILTKNPLPAVTAEGLQIIGTKNFVDGTNLGNADGLVLAGNNIVLYGVGFINFKGAGVHVTGNLDHVVLCALGTTYSDPYDAGPILSDNVGLYLDHATNTEVDGCTVGRNLTSGIEVRESGGVRISDSFIKDNLADGVLIEGTGGVRGLPYTTQLVKNIIIRNHEDGIRLVGSSYNRIGGGGDRDANFIGCVPVGDHPNAGNLRDGVRIEPSAEAASTANLLNDNVIGGNHGNGVLLKDRSTADNTLSTNKIGFSAVFVDDTTFVPFPEGNWLDGVAIVNGAHENQIGVPGGGNLIGANGHSGVLLSDPGTMANVLQNNYIGFYFPNNTGTGVAAPNHFDGVLIANGATNNLVGEPGLPGGHPGNVISGNSDAGVRITGAGTSGNKIQSNYIGTDRTGTLPLPNFRGISIDIGADGNAVGGLGDPTATTGSGNTVAHTGEGNLIAGNTDIGVYLVAVSQTTLESNFIGLDVTGEKSLPNSDGVVVLAAANHNDIGTFRAGNVISGNSGDGVVLSGAGTTANRLLRNTIGLTVSGKGSMGNSGDGVSVDLGASDNQIGVVPVLLNWGNTISSNGQNGVHLSGTGTQHNQFQGNLIGTDVSGTFAIPNEGDGVLIESGASDNRIGGVAGVGNVISGNTLSGVALGGFGTSGNWIQGNRIGTNARGDTAVGNGLEGVLITLGASGNLVGGPSAGPGAPGSLGNLISGNRQDGVGILLGGTTNNSVQGNLIGTKASGLERLANGHNGVLITAAASGNLVGGDTPNLGNLISGNKLAGVDIEADTNYVINNWVGIQATGIDSLANDGDGIDLFSSGNGVGWNVVSGNLGHGVAVTGSSNVIIANRIGTNAGGTAAVGNHQDGVYFQISSGPGGNWLGSPILGSGNLISGNGWNGVEAVGTPKANNRIQNNRIGTDATGFQSLGNSRNGIFINNTRGFLIGGTDAHAGNQVSGNSLDGILITGRVSTGLLVQGNLIGTNANATAQVANLGNGVHIDNFADANTVGGLMRSEGNVISGNVLDGVRLGPNRDEGNKVLGNKIGTDFNGKYSIANFQHGVEVVGSVHNTIGGPADGAGNLISGNSHDGIRLVNASSTLIAGNRIGIDFDGTHKIANSGNGVFLFGGSAGNTVGGVPMGTAKPGNVISGNGGSGVVLSDAGTTNNQVVGNFIGTTSTGDVPLGNTGDGVDIFAGATGNVIGGLGGVGDSLPGNIISGNSGDGVRLTGTGTSNNLILGNRIGTYATDQPWKGNVGHGVYIAAGASNNSVGGSAPQKGNVIANNGKAGVAVGSSKMDFNALHNTIQSNSIHGNLGLGIDLGDDFVSPNKPGGPNSGPNQFQNTPVIAGATVLNGITTITLSLRSAPLSWFVIQVFASPSSDPSGYGEGQTLLISKVVMTDLQKTTGPITLTVPQSLLGQHISATATAFSGDTSEFSNSMTVTAAASAKPGVGGAGASASGPAVIIGPVVAGPLAALSTDVPAERALRKAQGSR